MSRSRDRAIAERLGRWFERHARDLPWRRDRNGYTALVAEAMLQQTQVSRVLDRFEPFLERFPTVRALAEAPEQEVLAHWRGLGYYRRARHLHAAAKAIVERHDGEVPDSADALQQLPGVGRYTAGAIASIVFGRTWPIVDGNVARVLARLEGREGDVRDKCGAAWTWQRATELVNAADKPGTFNEAMMELGALVCSPRQPACEQCPLASRCVARRTGRQAEIPEARRAASRKAVHHHAVLFPQRDSLLVEQRPTDGLWAGMWQAPTVESPRRLGPKAVRTRLERRLDANVLKLSRVTSFAHHTTHRAVTFHVFRGVLDSDVRVQRGEWRAIGALDGLPFGSPQRRIIEMIGDELALAER